MPFGAVALTAYVPHNYPEGLEPGLEETRSTIRRTSASPSAPTPAWSRSTADTGKVTIVRYIAVDDVGNIMNPMIVDGMVHGGVAQGIGAGALRGREVRRRARAS